MRNKILYGLLVVVTAAMVTGISACSSGSKKQPENKETVINTEFLNSTEDTINNTENNNSNSSTGDNTSNNNTTDKNTTNNNTTDKNTANNSTTDKNTINNNTTEKATINNNNNKNTTVKDDDTSSKKSETTDNKNNTTASGDNTGESTSNASGNNNNEYVLKKYPTPVYNIGITSRDTVDSAITKIIEKNIKSSMTTEEKIKILHDYLVYTVDYDVNGMKKYNESTDADKYTNMTRYFADSVFEAKGAIINRLAVCQGYAEAFKLLMDKINVKSFIVYGTADGVNHAWNMVEIDGYWYHVDVTYDDPTRKTTDENGNVIESVVPNGENISYNYFLTTESIISENHVINKNVTERENSAVISNYPSSKLISNERFLNMVYPWIEINSDDEFEKVEKYLEQGVLSIRIAASQNVQVGDINSTFWSKVTSWIRKKGGGSYNISMSSHGKRTIIMLNITLNK